jgi:hypothetical protein
MPVKVVTKPDQGETGGIGGMARFGVAFLIQR